MSILTEFFNSSSIPRNADTEAIMDFLSSPESVNKMLVLAGLGLPSLSAVVQELENKFGGCPLFPLNHNAPNYNAPNRRNIGWMVKFILREYGYTPKASGSDVMRIGAFSGAKFFGSAAVYEKSNPNPNYVIKVTSK